MPALAQSRATAVVSPDTLREVHGRKFSNLNKQTYMLPADDKEFDRLSIQHIMLRVLLGGLLPVPDEVARGLLARENAAVLDVGSGSGHWPVDIAQQFPHVRVVGFDLVPARPAVTPSNCTFVQGDAHKDLAPFAGQFDIVHCRAMAHSSLDFSHIVREMTRCLRPGGLFVLCGGDLGLCNVRKQRASAAESSFVRLLQQVRAVDETRGVRARSQDFPALIVSAGGREMLEPEYRAYHCPIGWPGLPEDGLGENGELLGTLMLRNAKTFVPSWTPLLVSQGHPRASVDEWVRRAEDELRGPSKMMYTKWHYSWAFKDGKTG